MSDLKIKSGASNICEIFNYLLKNRQNPTNASITKIKLELFKMVNLK